MLLHNIFGVKDVGQDCILRAGLLPAQRRRLEIGEQVENLPHPLLPQRERK